MKAIVVGMILIAFSALSQPQKDHYLVINPKGHKSQIFDMCFDHKGNIVTGSLDKRVYVWNSKTGRIVKEFIGQIGPGAEGMVYTLDVSPNGKYLAVSGWMGKDDESENLGDIRIYNYETGSIRKRLKWHEDVVKCLRFSSDSQKLYSADASGYIARWDLSRMYVDMIYDHVNEGMNNIALGNGCFVSSHDDGMIYKWSIDKNKPVKKFNFFVKNTADMVVQSEVAISDDGEKIAAIGKELGMVLVLNSKMSLQQHFFTGNNEVISLAFAPSGNRMAISLDRNGHHLIKLYDLVDKEWVEQDFHRFDDLVQCLRFQDENALVVTGGRGNALYFMDIKKGEFKERSKVHGKGIDYYSANLRDQHLAFSNEPTKAYGRTPYTREFDLFQRSEVDGEVDTTAYNYPERFVAEWRIWEYTYLRQSQYDPSQVLLIEKDGVIGDSILFHPWTGNQFYTYALINDDLIVVGGGGGILQVHDREGKLLVRLVGHEGGLRSASLSVNGKFLISSGVDQTVRFWSMEEINKEKKGGEIFPVASFFLADNNEWVLWNQEGYFTASKKGATYIGYHVNQGKSVAAKFYPFDQFDLKYNRPDILMQDLEMADAGLIELYHLAYLKRLERMGIDEEDLSGDIHAPQISKFKTNQNGEFLNVSFEVEDKIYALNRINVYVNDVPIYGRKGIKIPDSPNQYAFQTEIQLMAGENKVEVSALNSAGVESLRETAYIENDLQTKGELFVAAVGVSDYQNSDFNLNYAAKDASDMINAMGKQEFYSNVHSKLLTNEKVNKESIDQLKSFFSQAGPNDVVLLFIAGHGVLDENYDYYFCTHDMDFLNPSKNGVSYTDLEALFDGIKPIRKLLIMDTCHSGELYKDEVEEVVLEETEEQEDVVFRSNKGTTTVRTRQGLQKTNEVVKEMFNDLNRGTGTTVLSSAGGVEYAMESDNWNNGLFTYCFLNGISDKQADLNSDGKIYLSELQSFVMSEVYKLSDGKQQPTSRFENLSLDYRIW